MSVVLRATGLRIVADNDDTILNLDSLQGLWTEEQYLRLTNGSNRLLEFTDGSIEVLPMPTKRHQVILRFLFLALYSFTEQHGGTVFFAPLRVQIREGKYREPICCYFAMPMIRVGKTLIGSVQTWLWRW